MQKFFDMKQNLTQIETPLGLMYAYATDQGICLLEFSNRKKFDRQIQSLTNSLDGIASERDASIFLETLKKELLEYFAGKRKQFTVPLHLIGTDFQKKVWHELLKIPFGETISYKQLAENIGNSKASRAVANANATNKISIIIPCHRVIGSNKQLTGYAAGLDKKRFLLTLEGKQNFL